MLTHIDNAELETRGPKARGLEARGLGTLQRDEERDDGLAILALRVLAAVAIVWYMLLLGTFAIALSLGPSDMTAHSLYLSHLPMFPLMLWGLSAGFGLVASVAMFFRRLESYPAFMLSLVVALAHLYDMMGRVGAAEADGIVMHQGELAGTVTVLVMTLFLFWASYNARTFGQLR